MSSIPSTSPWGPVTGGRIVAAGIVQVHTRRHGGYLLSEDRVASMPVEFGHPSRGPGVYEEDIDCSLVVMAFYEHFTDVEVFQAVRTARTWFHDRPEVQRWIDDSQVVQVARRWQWQHAAFWLLGSLGPSAAPGYLSAYLCQVGARRSVSVLVPQDDLRTLFSPRDVQRLQQTAGRLH